ncbi:hypothetical protein ACFLT7_06240, partial [candidate division KSB1 bacterium]
MKLPIISMLACLLSGFSSPVSAETATPPDSTADSTRTLQDYQALADSLFRTLPDSLARISPDSLARILTKRLPKQEDGMPIVQINPDGLPIRIYKSPVKLAPMPEVNLEKT